IGNPSLNHRYRKGFYSLFKTLQQNRLNKRSLTFFLERMLGSFYFKIEPLTIFWVNKSLKMAETGY
ncbi:hypothetical protein ABXM05_14065, partial [Enterococcus faecalis]|uniref:hypothetical protein n=1 Tax=Enterococcus faecalis TaxID=1351 RepID=UPI00338FE556